MEQFGFHWTDFREVLYLNIFRKPVEKIQVSLKSGKTNIHFWSYLSQFFLQREMFHTEGLEKIRTQSVCSITFLFKSCRLWDNVETYRRAGQTTHDNVIRRMPIACWITKATHTLTICNIYCFSTATMVVRTRLNVTLYVHCLSC